MVDILLSTYNGAKYLKDFISSLMVQTFRDFRLIIRDDGSADETPQILEDLKCKNSERVEIIKDNLGNLGPCKSFLFLLQRAESKYVMFADQDDIWLPEKIEMTLRKMQELENKYGKETPLLVHTDLKVVDEKLKVLADSFWKYQGLNPRYKDLNYLIVQNNVTGCTVMINQALKNLVKTIPERAIMHDWWLALVASAFGVIDYIPKLTILYRQHQAQNTGARPYSVKYFFKKFMMNPEEAFKAVKKTLYQAQDFLKMYENLLTDAQKEILLTYVKLPYFGTIDKIKKIWKWKLFKQGFLRNAGFILTLLLLRSEVHVTN